MLDEEQVFACQQRYQWFVWLLVLVLGGLVLWWAWAPGYTLLAHQVWHRLWFTGTAVLLLRHAWLAYRRPHLLRVVVNAEGLTVHWQNAAAVLPWDEIAEARHAWRGLEPVMRILRIDGREVDVPPMHLWPETCSFQYVVATHVGERTRQRLEAELLAGQPMPLPPVRRGMALGAVAYLAGLTVVLVASCWRSLVVVYRFWLEEHASEQAVVLFMWPVGLVLVGLAAAYVLWRDCKEYRFTPTALEERWPGWRRELAYADIERVVVRRQRKRFLAERMAIIGPRRKFRLDQTMARYEAVLGLLRKLAPQAVVIEEER